MTIMNRPNPITTISKDLDSRDDTDSSNLETYITDLEANQLDRPASIVAILNRINAQYPADIGTAIEAYIKDLESKQQAVSQTDGKRPLFDSENPPVWSYQRAKQRELHHQERAAREWKMLNNYL